jgi:hypothetical protein
MKLPAAATGNQATAPTIPPARVHPGHAREMAAKLRAMGD